MAPPLCGSSNLCMAGFAWEPTRLTALSFRIFPHPLQAKFCFGAGSTGFGSWEKRLSSSCGTAAALHNALLQPRPYRDHRLKVEDVVEIRGVVREDSRSKAGFEVHVRDVQVLNRAGNTLPFQSADDVEAIGLDTLLQFRPLALRTEAVGDVFRIQAALLSCFRDALNRRRFTEIVTSKIVSGGTEGGSNLFEIQVFRSRSLSCTKPTVL